MSLLQLSGRCDNSNTNNNNNQHYHHNLYNDTYYILFSRSSPITQKHTHTRTIIYVYI